LTSSREVNLTHLFSADRPWEDVEPGAILVCSTPEVPSCGYRGRSVLPKSAPKLPAAFVGDMVAGFEQDQLAVARTGAEDIIQPDSMADDIDRSFERRLNPPKCVN